MNYKNLFWIIPLTSLLTIFLTIIILSNLDLETESNICNYHIAESNLIPCWDGCYYAESILYNQSEMLKPSELYSKCADICWNEK